MTDSPSAPLAGRGFEAEGGRGWRLLGRGGTGGGGGHFGGYPGFGVVTKGKGFCLAFVCFGTGIKEERFWLIYY